MTIRHNELLQRFQGGDLQCVCVCVCVSAWDGGVCLSISEHKAIGTQVPVRSCGN